MNLTTMFFYLFQPCVIRIEDVYETAEVLYIVLELYHFLIISNVSLVMIKLINVFANIII